MSDLSAASTAPALEPSSEARPADADRPSAAVSNAATENPEDAGGDEEEEEEEDESRGTRSAYFDFRVAYVAFFLLSTGLASLILLLLFPDENYASRVGSRLSLRVWLGVTTGFHLFLSGLQITTWIFKPFFVRDGDPDLSENELDWARAARQESRTGEEPLQAMTRGSDGEVEWRDVPSRSVLQRYARQHNVDVLAGYCDIFLSLWWFIGLLGFFRGPRNAALVNMLAPHLHDVLIVDVVLMGLYLYLPFFMGIIAPLLVIIACVPCLPFLYMMLNVSKATPGASKRQIARLPAKLVTSEMLASLRGAVRASSAGAAPVGQETPDLEAQAAAAQLEEPCCAICFVEFEVNVSKVHLLPCDDRHIFHVECVAEWLRVNASCPVCREPVFGKKKTRGTDAPREQAEEQQLGALPL